MPRQLATCRTWRSRRTTPRSSGTRAIGGCALYCASARGTCVFDEPTSGLDPIIGQSILNYIQSCHRRLRFTGIIVTHDVPRVFSIVQKIAMMYDGRIIINGSYEEILRQNDPVFNQFLSESLEGPLHYV